eukprot:GHVT01016743.1.p1 GENE.GHVT01016743.1~~GHVT01016743.1.p1  ORF type:complete len:790 (-),score=25.20 GHVT01016743.1:1084-3453(-)
MVSVKKWRSSPGRPTAMISLHDCEIQYILQFLDIRSLIVLVQTCHRLYKQCNASFWTQMQCRDFKTFGPILAVAASKPWVSTCLSSPGSRGSGVGNLVDSVFQCPKVFPLAPKHDVPYLENDDDADHNNKAYGMHFPCGITFRGTRMGQRLPFPTILENFQHSRWHPRTCYVMLYQMSKNWHLRIPPDIPTDEVLKRAPQVFTRKYGTASKCFMLSKSGSYFVTVSRLLHHKTGDSCARIPVQLPPHYCDETVDPHIYSSRRSVLQIWATKFCTLLLEIPLPSLLTGLYWCQHEVQMVLACHKQVLLLDLRKATLTPVLQLSSSMISFASCDPPSCCATLGGSECSSDDITDSSTRTVKSAGAKQTLALRHPSNEEGITTENAPNPWFFIYQTATEENQIKFWNIHTCRPLLIKQLHSSDVQHFSTNARARQQNGLFVLGKQLLQTNSNWIIAVSSESSVAGAQVCAWPLCGVATEDASDRSDNGDEPNAEFRPHQSQEEKRVELQTEVTLQVGTGLKLQFCSNPTACEGSRWTCSTGSLNPLGNVIQPSQLNSNNEYTEAVILQEAAPILTFSLQYNYFLAALKPHDRFLGPQNCSLIALDLNRPGYPLSQLDTGSLVSTFQWHEPSSALVFSCVNGDLGYAGFSAVGEGMCPSIRWRKSFKVCSKLQMQTQFSVLVALANDGIPSLLDLKSGDVLRNIPMDYCENLCVIPDRMAFVSRPDQTPSYRIFSVVDMRPWNKEEFHPSTFYPAQCAGCRDALATWSFDSEGPKYCSYMCWCLRQRCEQRVS